MTTPNTTEEEKRMKMITVTIWKLPRYCQDLILCGTPEQTRSEAESIMCPEAKTLKYECARMSEEELEELGEWEGGY